MTLLYHSSAYIKRSINQHTREKPKHSCLLQHYSQYPSCGIGIVAQQLNTMEYYSKKNEIMSFAGNE
jgi:hypothetical protein